MRTLLWLLGACILFVAPFARAQATSAAERVPAPPLGVESAPPDWTDDEMRPADPFAPLPAPASERVASVAPAAHGALIGQLVALGIGAVMGAFAFELTGCTNDPMAGAWSSCEHDRWTAVLIGAALLSPVGTAAGAIAGGQLAGQHGSVGDAFWVATLSWVTSVIAVPIGAGTDEPLAGMVAAHAISNVVSCWLAAVAFEGHWQVAARVDSTAVVVEAATRF